MTDNKIIKALELCSVVPQQCSQCPYYGRKDCVADSAKDAIDLIQRQQGRFEQIEKKLEKEIDWMNVLVGDGNLHAECHLEGLKKALRIVQGVSNDDR